MEEAWKNLLSQENDPDTTTKDDIDPKGDAGDGSKVEGFEELLPKVEKPEGVENWNEREARLEAFKQEAIKAYKQSLSPEERALIEAKESGADYAEVFNNRRSIEELESITLDKLTESQHVLLYKILKNEDNEEVAEAAVLALAKSGKLISELDSLRTNKVKSYKNAIEASELQFKKDLEAAEAKHFDNITPFIEELESTKTVLGIELTDEDKTFAKELLSSVKGTRAGKNVVATPKIYELLNNPKNLVALGVAIKHGLFEDKISLAAKSAKSKTEDESDTGDNVETLSNFAKLLKLNK